MVKLTINGAVVEVSDPDMPLLWAIREEAGLTGTKFTCGKGLCGACTIHIDGQPARSCVVPSKVAVGKTISTIEGIAGTLSTRYFNKRGSQKAYRNAVTVSQDKSCPR